MADDIGRRLAQIGKGVVQINMRLNKVLAAVEGPASDGGAAHEPLFDLIDAVDATLAQEAAPVPVPWWARWTGASLPPSVDLAGLRLARDRAVDQLARAGVKPAPATGTCDPALHQVVETVPAGGRPPGTIVRTHRRGWFRPGEPAQVLRTAHVTAAKEGL